MLLKLADWIGRYSVSVHGGDRCPTTQTQSPPPRELIASVPQPWDALPAGNWQRILQILSQALSRRLQASEPTKEAADEGH